MIKYRYFLKCLLSQKQERAEGGCLMEKYVAAELELVALAAADVISISIEYDENETEVDRFEAF